MPALISISRDSGYADRWRDYRVVCDDKEIGRISNGASTKFTISPGPHRLILKIDWGSSNEVSFSISSDQVLTFSCGSNLRGLKLLFSLYYATFAHDRYLWLRQDGT